MDLAIPNQFNDHTHTHTFSVNRIASSVLGTAKNDLSHYAGCGSTDVKFHPAAAKASVLVHDLITNAID